MTASRRAAAQVPSAPASAVPASIAPRRRTAEVRRAADMVRTLIERLLGGRPKRIVHRASGLTNLVFEVAHAQGDVVVRIGPSAGKLHAFIKEQWAMERARDAGVPVPQVLEVGGETVPQPYMIVRKAPGREATQHPDRTAVLREMGRLTARIHTIRTHGFGQVFDWSHNVLSRHETWREFLADELRIDERIELLERHRMLAPAQLARLRRTLESIGAPEARAALNHGDMRAKNVMVDAAGAITAVLDWEDCCSSVAPVWDLAIALHDLSVDDKQTFLEGYGLSPSKILDLAPALKAVNLINYADHVAYLAREKNTAALQQYRTRMSGALDLYSL